jgi:6-phosphogluconolactonase
MRMPVFIGQRLSAFIAFGGILMLTLTNTHSLFAKTIVYISNAESREINVCELDPADGSLRDVQKVSTSGNVMPLAVNPQRTFLYASLRSEPWSVSAFAIDSTSGALKEVGTEPLADNMAYLSTDRTGRYLLAASYAGNRISVNAITPAGAAEPKPLAVIPTGKNAHAIASDPSNQFVFVTNLGDDQILQFRFDPTTGRLTPNTPPSVATKKGAGPRHFVFHPTRSLVFSTNELDGTVDTWRLDPSSGRLTSIGSTSLMPPNFSGGAPAAADIHLTPDGRFLYTSERTSNTLAAFSIDPDTGRLTIIGHYPTETQPRGFNIDPDGKYLLAVGQKSNGLSTYAIDPQTGKLTLLHQRQVGKAPNWVEIIALPK